MKEDFSPGYSRNCTYSALKRILNAAGIDISYGGGTDAAITMPEENLEDGEAGELLALKAACYLIDDTEGNEDACVLIARCLYELALRTCEERLKKQLELEP